MTGVVVSQQGVGSVPDSLLNAFVQSTTLATDLLTSPGKSGMNAYVTGTFATGDGGQGFYNWNPTATGPTSYPAVVQPTGVTTGAWVQIPNTGLGVVGTWTPVLTLGGAAVGMTYATQVGQYQIIGRYIVASFVIVLTAKGSSTGNAVISGLPAPANGTFGLAGSAATYASAMVSLTGALTMTTQPASSFINLIENGAIGQTPAQDNNFTNTSTVAGTVVYPL